MSEAEEQPATQIPASLIRERLVGGGAWVLAGMIVNAFSGIAISAELARLLSPGELGLYFVALSMTTIAASVAQLGMNRSVVQLVASAAAVGDSGTIRTVLLRVFLLGGSAAFILAILLATYPGHTLARQVLNAPTLIAVMPIIGVWTVALALKTLAAESFRGLHDIRAATIFSGFATNLACVAVFGLFLALEEGSHLAEAVFVTTAVGCGAAAGAAYLLYKATRRLPPGLNARLPAILPQSLPRLAVGLLLLMMGELHLWMIAALRSKEEAAMYGAALRVVLLVTVPLLMVNAVIPSSVAELYAKNLHGKLEKLLRATSAAIVAFGLAGFSACVALGDKLLAVVYGEPFSHAAPALIVLAAAHLVNLFTGSPGVLLMMSRRGKIMMLITAVSTVLSLSASYMLVPWLGMTGGAIGAGIGIISINVMMWLYCWRVLKIKTHPDFRLLVRTVAANLSKRAS